MTAKDSAFLGLRSKQPEHKDAPEVASGIPNIDHRFGDGRAELIGIEILDTGGHRVGVLEANSTIVVRISARAKAAIKHPIIGFMLRNHLGVDFAGTNTAREGLDLPPMAAGEISTVDFHLEIPELYASTFSFSPAVAEGTLQAYTICDWIDNAVALQMAPGSAPIYGAIHLKCHVEVNRRLATSPAMAVSLE